MTPLGELFVVSHTHWDREWYRTEERFRQRLVRLIDELLDDPPAAGESFLLDGQAVLLDDYLAVRPERAAELSALLRDGRIEAGPWYVLADELIPSGEALVRNLLMGRETVRRLRGEPPPVLYCPDSFGHPAILPELAAGFGCELIVLWRGLKSSTDTREFRGPSGAVVRVYHLPPDGYEFGSSLPVVGDDAASRWQRIHEVMGPRATTGVALLLNGADHHARQRDRDAALRALATAANPVRVVPGSLRAASEAIVGAQLPEGAAALSGELRDSYGYTWTLQGTFGTRAAQKRRNAIAERLLVRDVEPWIALLPHGGDASTRALLRSAWRTLLQAHPHDTLCGTSIDAVAEAFDHRLDSTMQQALGVRDDTRSAIIWHDAERARAEHSRWTPAVVLRNPVARRRGGVVELTLRAKVADIAVGPGSASRQGPRRAPDAWSAGAMPLQVLSGREVVELTESPRAYPDADRIREARALGWVEPMGGYVMSVIGHGAGESSPILHPVIRDGLSLDNGLVRVDVSAGGRVTLHDRALGRRIDDVISLESARDVGDSYTPAIRESLPVPAVTDVSVAHDGPLRGEIGIAFAYGDGSSARVGIQLDANVRFVRVTIDGENRERDHRLRVAFPAAGPEFADAAFWPVCRAPIERDAAGSTEHVVRTAPLHRWVMMSGTVVISDGLAEYEAAGGRLAVTLTRSIGELSRADLPERPGHAGWPAETPGAQCIGPYAAAFAIQLSTGEDLDEIEQLADDFLLPITGETLRSNLAAPGTYAGLELVGGGLKFSAAMPSQQAGWITLRCVNASDTEVRGEWRVGRAITEANTTRLDETILAPCVVSGNIIHFTAAPKELVTILARE